MTKQTWVLYLAASAFTACSSGPREADTGPATTAGGGAGAATVAGTGSFSGAPVVATVGASSSSGTPAAGGSGGGQAGAGGAAVNQAAPLCQRACQKLASAACGDFNDTDCSECSSEETCQSELDAYGSCVVERGSPSCDLLGTTVAQCATELQAYSSCTACAAQPSDTACQACEKTACCVEARAFASAPDFAGFDTCMLACESAECSDSCFVSFPLAGAAYEASNACREESCQAPCSACAPDAEDTSCWACVKSSCCDTWQAFTNVVDAAGIDTCLRACADADCDAGCVARYPVAGAAYRKLTDECMTTTCSGACNQ